MEIHARALTVGCDGRKSIVRERAGLEVKAWVRRSMCCGFAFRVNRPTPVRCLGRFVTAKIMVHAESR